MRTCPMPGPDGVRCEAGLHDCIDGHPQHWAIVAEGTILVWDYINRAHLEGPVAQGLAALGEALFAIGEEWEFARWRDSACLLAIGDACRAGAR